MRKIDWKNKARRQAKKISDKKLLAKIFEAIETLADWPECSNVKRLTNIGGYRLRIGNWRVFFTVTTKTIIITEVKIRDENTY